MTLRIQVVPANNKLFAEMPLTPRLATSEADLISKCQDAYQEYFLGYEQRIAVSPQHHHYPKVIIVLDDEEQEVAFDFGLYETLLEVYALEGWSGIVQIEQALESHLSKQEEYAPSAGETDKRNHWLPVKQFFRFTRNLVCLLVRNSMIAIEQRAASAITASLSTSAFHVGKAWNEFRVAYREELISIDKAGKPTVRRNFSFQNSALSDALFQELSKAVEQKMAYERALRRAAHFYREVELVRGYLRRSQRGAPATEKPRYDVAMAELKFKEADVRELAQQTENLFNSMKAVVYGISPVGLIVLDGLEVGFDRKEMEQKLGQALWELRDNLEGIGERVDAYSSHVSSKLEGVVFDNRAIRNIENWDPPSKCVTEGIERYVLDTAIDALAKDPSWFPLAHEGTLHALVDSGMIVKDSFEYIVYFHYVSALMKRVSAEQEAEWQVEGFWQAFARIAAGLSLASLVTPATAGAAPLLRGVSAVADMIALSHTVCSVIANLAQLDQVLAETLIRPDALALQGMSRLGELLGIRREVIEQIEIQILAELALTVTGAKWLLLKQLMLARGYYYDLEVLFGDGNNG